MTNTPHITIFTPDTDNNLELPLSGTVCFEYERPNAWCFDYDKLVERTGLNLDTEFVWEDEIKIV